jgi:hypothetical protein
MSFLLIYRVLARNGRTGVVLEHLRLSTFILNALRFEGNGSLETGEEGRVIGEFDVDLGAIAAILVEVANPDHFAGKFFALNHGVFTLTQRFARPNALEGNDLILAKSCCIWSLRTVAEYHTHRV